MFSDYDDLRAEGENETTPVDESDLRVLVQRLQEQIKLQQDQLDQASQDMATMRQGFQRLLEKEDTSKNNNERCVSSISVNADFSYFDSYAHFGIHHEMLSVSGGKQ